MSIEDTVSVARQMADALEAAHERGVVHRDLKPANVKLRPDGIVKVLDFGLATAFDSVDEPDESRQRDTPFPARASGGIVGTPRYMSPELRSGQTADKRCDIWAFGAVLYEMLAGRPPFAAQAIPQTAATREEIDWSGLHRNTPDAVQRLIARCLERNPRQRLRDIGEARIALESGRLDLSAGSTVPRKRRAYWRRAVPVTAAALAAAGLTAAVTMRLKPSPSAVVARFTVALPDSQALARASGRHAIAISPDGNYIVYAGVPAALYRRDLSQSEPTLIKGTEGFGRVSEPAFSPDGRSIAFYANGAIRTIAVTGGSVSTLVAAEPPYGMGWGRNGIVFGQGAKGIARATSHSDTAEVLVRVNDGEEAHGPQVLPGGRHVMFTLASGTASDRWDRARIVVQSLSSGERVSIIEGGSDARYLPSGHVVYARKGVLYLIAFDVERIAARGTPWPAVENVAQAVGGQTGAADAVVSDSGVLVYVPARPGSAAVKDDVFRLAMIDRRGEATLLALPADNYQNPRLSPDGTRVAFETEGGGESAIWISDVAGATNRQRLTFAGNSRFPIWSNDSRRIVFQSDRDGDQGLFIQPADGSASGHRLTRSGSDAAHVPQSWSPTDAVLLLTMSEAAQVSLWTLSLNDKHATAFPNVPTAESISAAFSPDGKWVAYAVGAQGSVRLRVQPFPPTGAVYQLDPGNATPSQPAWSTSGDEIFFNPGLRGFGAVAITRAPTFAFGTPMMLPRPFLLSPPERPRAYDVMSDGRFLARVPADANLSAARPGTRMQVVLNWLDELRANGVAGRRPGNTSLGFEPK
jgi:serine/threonine-protein kinase